MNYPTPEWNPARAEEPSWFVSRMAFYTDRLKSFLVYEHGTIVFNGELSEPDVAACNAFLLDAVTQSPDFSVRPMRDGNFLVRFRGPVYGLVSGEFAKQNHQQLLSDAQKMGLLPGEALLQSNKAAILAGHDAIGLYARASLYLDAKAQLAVGRFIPSKL